MSIYVDEDRVFERSSILSFSNQEITWGCLAIHVTHPLADAYAAVHFSNQTSFATSRQ